LWAATVFGVRHGPSSTGDVRLVLLGKPGSGKSTQGSALARHLGVPHISTGELLRRRVAAGGDGQRELAGMLERGDLVPDDLVLPVVRAAVDAATGQGGYIFEGFPRTIAQAEADVLPVDRVFYLALPDECARERLAGSARAGRADDGRDVIEHRLHQFHTDTEPVLDLYARRGLLTTVDASQPPEEVTAAILRELNRDPADTPREQ
jgi:adenylate kinase